MNLFLRAVILIFGAAFGWELITIIFQLPNYILPTPVAVLSSIYQHHQLLFNEAIPTIIETALGFSFGIVLGVVSAISITYFRPVRFWLLPLLIISQAVPTFVVAPLFVMWFGFGMASKIITTVIMLFFPITSAFYDGLQKTPQVWLDLASTMQASKWRTFWHIRIPSALPALASGLRMSAAIAPIGAVIGEWVGASRGLGYLMLNANARMQIDLMFAALIGIVLMAFTLYFCTDKLLKQLIPWHDEARA